MQVKDKNKHIKKDSSYGWWIILIIFLLIWFFAGNEDQSSDLIDETSSASQLDSQDKVYIPEPKKNDAQFVERSIGSIESEELIDYEEGKFSRELEWNYQNYNYGVTLTLYPKVYEVFKERERIREYDLFASDSYSKPFIKSLTESLKEYGLENRLSNDEIPYFIISFVQNLPYTSDDVTTGFDEYPRFPYETFYDNGGDCEDTAILASSMLHELGYGVALLRFSDHMAVGVKCTPSAGQSYYTQDGIKYCYLETTGKNWNVGQVPPNIAGESAIVTPIYERPYLDIDFDSTYRYNWLNVYTDVDVTVSNLGSENADDMKIYVALQTKDENKVWGQIESEEISLEPEGVYEYKVTNLESPTGEPFRIYVRAYGSNVVSDEAVSDWIYWK